LTKIPGDNKNVSRGGFRMRERVAAKDELRAKNGELPANDNVAEGREP
jgi:hypothetical protein